MLLSFPNRELFATGAVAYDYSAIPGSDNSARVLLHVKIAGLLTAAIVDTGAPYFICAPDVARLIGFAPAAALGKCAILIRGYRVKGSLHRAELTLLASAGESLIVEIIAFVPTPDEPFNFPSFLGFTGCLEWIRFAIDPFNQTFYFGAHS